MKTDAYPLQMNEAAAKAKISNIIFWISACFLLFWALGTRSILGSEGRWAEITREMFLTKDFFHPTINGVPYFDKPLLTYWLIAIVSTVFGKLNEWTVRLPSAVSGLITIWSTCYIGRKLWSKEIAKTAGWLLLLTYGVLCFARTGEADMENLAATTLAIAWYFKIRENRRFSSYLVFYLICFVGAHLKGLTAVVIPAIAVFPDLLRENRWRRHINVSHFLAMFAGLSVYLVPFVIASMTVAEMLVKSYEQSGLFLVFKENILRYFQPFDHKDPWYTYLYHLPILLLPLSPIILVGLINMVKRYKKLDNNTRWAIESTVLIFLFFTISGSRRSYYILPIFPMLALITSVFLCSDGNEKWKKIGIVLQSLIIIIFALIEILTPTIWPIAEARTGFYPPDNLRIITPVLGLLAMLSLLYNRFLSDVISRWIEIPGKIIPSVTASVILLIGFFCFQEPMLEEYHTLKPFATELRSLSKGVPLKDVVFYKRYSSETHRSLAKILFFTDFPEPIQLLVGTEAAQKFLESDREQKILITRREYITDFLHALPEEEKKSPTLSEKIHEWEKRTSPSKFVAWKITEQQK